MAEASLDTSQVDLLARDLVASGVKATGYAVAAVRVAAAAVEAGAVVEAPKVTGELAASIGTDYENGGLVAIVGPEAFYGGWVEEGSSHQPPQPYLGPAFDSTVALLDSGLVRIAEKTL